MARGKRPVSFRTRKLSLSAPMVLPWRRGGRVGRRRTTIPEGAPASVLGPLRHAPTPPPQPPFPRKRHPPPGAFSPEKAPPTPAGGSAAGAGFLRGRPDVVGEPRVQRRHVAPGGADLVQGPALVQPCGGFPTAGRVQ